ncbi:MAG: hypothetical protein WCY09_08210 [Candidatus Omnitrophota bacterium]
MAAYFTVCKGTSIEWHVGEDLRRLIRLLGGGVELNVIQVQADGDELEHIKNNFTGLPMHNTRRIQTWRGDHAQFITDNL